MPNASPTPCHRTPGCGGLVRDGKCSRGCASTERARGNSNARGYGHRWRVYRAGFLLEYPLCGQGPDAAAALVGSCKAEGRPTAANVVDHIVDHKGDEEKFWDPKNHRASCKPHHDARIDAGDFGRDSE